MAERVDVLHVAAHGRHSADNPLFSGLELADGPWFGYDIDQLAVDPVDRDPVRLRAGPVLGALGPRDDRDDGGLAARGHPVRHRGAGQRGRRPSPARCSPPPTQGLAAGAPPAEALLDAVPTARADLSSFLCYGAGW